MEKKEYVFSVSQEDWGKAVKKAEETIAQHSKNGCSYGKSDGMDDYINDCECELE